MKIQVNITKEILRQSMNCPVPQTKKASEEAMVGQNCAIGKAIFNLFGDKSFVMKTRIVIDINGIDGIKIMNDREYSPSLINIEIDEEVAIFINDFDNFSPEKRLEMAPFSFEIELPEEVINLIGISEITKILEETPSLDLVKQIS